MTITSLCFSSPSYLFSQFPITINITTPNYSSSSHRILFLRFPIFIPDPDKPMCQKTCILSTCDYWFNTDTFPYKYGLVNTLKTITATAALPLQGQTRTREWSPEVRAPDKALYKKHGPLGLKGLIKLVLSHPQAEKHPLPPINP